MAGFFKRLFPRRAPARDAVRTTGHPDWEHLIQEIYNRVIEGTRFGIGLASTGDGGQGLRFRLNQKYPNPKLTEFVRTHLRPENFASFFEPGPGLGLDGRRGLLMVTDGKLGLPEKTLICPIVHNGNPRLRALVLFGGERLEGQLEARLEELESALAGNESGQDPDSASTASAADEQQRREEYIDSLQKMDTGHLQKQDFDFLMEIVNELDEVKEDLPRTLKPKYGTVTRYVLKKRLGT